VVIQAGVDGIRRRLKIEQITPRPLPKSLGEALTLLEGNDLAGEWLGRDLLSAYVLFKRAEIQGLSDLDEGEICRRYVEVY
jgi:glutamine synthetase